MRPKIAISRLAPTFYVMYVSTTTTMTMTPPCHPSTVKYTESSVLFIFGLRHILSWRVSGLSRILFPANAHEKGWLPRAAAAATARNAILRRE